MLADLQATLGSGPLLEKSFSGSFVKVMAGAVHLLYGFLVWIAKQALPDTAEGDWLYRWAKIWGVNRVAASFADGNVTFTGTNSTLIPAGTIVQSASGVQFATDEDATISSGTATVAVTATIAGANGNLAATTALSLLSPITGINSSLVVAAGGLAGGADQETDTALRSRLLQRIRKPPQGGSVDDYERWALEVSGIGRAFVFKEYDGIGTVGVAVLSDNEDSILPSDAKVTEVQTYIDDESRRPVTANVIVFKPTLVATNFTIAVSPATDAVKQAVRDSLEALIKRERKPGATLYLSKIREAVSLAAGENDNSVTSPSANVTHTSSQMVSLGTVTFS